MRKTKAYKYSNWVNPLPWKMKKHVGCGYNWYHLYDANGEFVSLIDEKILKFIEEAVNEYVEKSTK